MSPQQYYRSRLLEEVAAFAPTSILEVGCGSGMFLRTARSITAHVYGLDVNEAAIEALKAEGFSASVGSSDKLPFEDESWDIVVFAYTAHHIADWGQAAREAWRCCRKAVVVLDPWHDMSIPSQSVADQFDRWAKQIDRSTGIVHNDCLDTAALLDGLPPIQTLPLLKVQHLLNLEYFDPDEVKQFCGEQLNVASDAARWISEMEQIIERSHQDGFSHSGAILLVVSK